MRSPTELTTRIMKEAIGGLSLVKFDTSGYSLTNNIRFFSRDKCLQFNKIKQIKAKTVKNLICPIKRNQTETCKNGASFPTIHQLPNNYLIFHQKLFPNPVYNNNIIKQKKIRYKNWEIDGKGTKLAKAEQKEGSQKSYFLVLFPTISQLPNKNIKITLSHRPICHQNSKSKYQIKR